MLSFFFLIASDFDNDQLDLSLALRSWVRFGGAAALL
jgi:hypothetical protein